LGAVFLFLMLKCPEIQRFHFGIKGFCPTFAAYFEMKIWMNSKKNLRCLI